MVRATEWLPTLAARPSVNGPRAMDSVGLRCLGAALAALAGALLGLWAGQWLDAPATGLCIGACIASAVWAGLDAWRGSKVADWLRAGSEQPAPALEGFWGELAYRAERAIRTRDRLYQQEREGKAHFLRAIEASPNGVLLLDDQHRVEWCSRVAAEHLGLDPVRDLLQPITNLVRHPAFVEHLGLRMPDQTVTFQRPGGKLIAAWVRPYGDGASLLLTQDVTQHERSEAMRRDFVANVSHEIRTPLTVLSGSVQTLADLPLAEAERARVLVLMKQQAQRMQSLVADLLTLAQLEGSARPDTDVWVDAQQLMLQAHAMAESLSAGRHVLEFKAVDAVDIAGHEAELTSALGNLVSNAVRYTPEGGRVRVSFILPPSGGLRIEVKDSGIGVAREHLSRLTERFYRVDSSRSRDTGGTGLGLAIVKHVMQRHSGELLIASEPGVGSTFTLVFPASRVRVPQASPQSVA